MTAEELQIKQEELLEEIKQRAVSLGLEKSNIQVINDGVPDIKGYIESFPKIMWILKEPHDDFDEDGKPCGGDWSHLDFIRNSQCGNVPTWQVITYIMTGIKENLHYLEMPYVRVKPSMMDNIHAMAFINLSKMPNHVHTSMSELRKNFMQWKDIVLKQIEIYDPNVIIFGNTFSLFENEKLYFESETLNPNDNAYLDIRRWNNKLLLNAYHPCRKGEHYVDTIIDAVHDFIKTNRYESKN